MRVYVAVSVLYFAVYFALNLLTERRSLAEPAITLWSPDNTLSVMLIMESWTFAPVVWLAQIASDFVFGSARISPVAIVSAETTLAAGYLGMALALRRGFGFVLRDMRPRDLVALMAVTPLGAALAGLAYCGVLVGVGAIDPPNFLASYAGFWVGDAAAMGILIPATGAALRLYAAKAWRGSKAGFPLLLFLATVVFLALVIGYSASEIQRRYLFNLTFLPILLLGLKFGYDVGALALLVVQIFLLVALEYFHVPDYQYGGYQIMMFILSVSGLALGATVTEWSAATAQLRRQQADLAKVSERATNGAMAAAMSHEISQPLASIATYVFAARRLLEKGQGEDKAISALREAEAQAGRARVIIERLRDFVAKGEVARESVDLEALIARIIRIEDDAARERGVALRRIGGEAHGLHAFIDRVGVEQAIVNLVLNAIEAAPAQTGAVDVSLERRGERAIVAVADNGPGVADEIADRLFEPFETTKPRGMGLGLPLAKEIATRHGGDLRWRPVAPNGVRFELELPLA